MCSETPTRVNYSRSYQASKKLTFNSTLRGDMSKKGMLKTSERQMTCLFDTWKKSKQSNHKLQKRRLGSNNPEDK